MAGRLPWVQRCGGAAEPQKVRGGKLQLCLPAQPEKSVKFRNDMNRASPVCYLLSLPATDSVPFVRVWAPCLFSWGGRGAGEQGGPAGAQVCSAAPRCTLSGFLPLSSWSPSPQQRPRPLGEQAGSHVCQVRLPVAHGGATRFSCPLHLPGLAGPLRGQRSPSWSPERSGRPQPTKLPGSETLHT